MTNGKTGIGESQTIESCFCSHCFLKAIFYAWLLILEASCFSLSFLKL